MLAAVTVPVVIVAFYWPWWDGIETIAPIINWSQGPMFNNYVPDILAYYLTRRASSRSAAARSIRARRWPAGATRSRTWRGSSS